MAIPDTEKTLKQIHDEFVEAQKPFQKEVPADDPDYARRVLSRPENADDEEF